MSLLESLILVSEKAANIARLCRQEEELFKLLIQEKDDSEANPRFVQDFKTLADVLIQEMVKYDIGKKFPELKNSINGEESNTFTNAVNETVCVEIQETVKDSAELLVKVLDGHADVANILATAVHGVVHMEQVDTTIPLNDNLKLDFAKLGMWIDPIDSTSEYVNANEEKDDSGIYTKGLRCVTVLIGVYDKTSGNPVLGVVNQPFSQLVESRWRGRCFWGIAETRTNSLPPSIDDGSSSIVCISSTEDDFIRKKLLENDFSVIEAAGAGYKLLMVILGLADAYVLSKSSTFKWDTCACQAILMSLGGDIVQFNESHSSITYRDVKSGENRIEVCCNSSGIIAGRNREILMKIRKVLG